MSERRIQRQLRRSNRRRSRHSRRQARGSVLFNRFLRLTLGPWIARAFNAQPENIGVVRRLRPPYVVVPNHSCVWDPFLVNNFVPVPIHYVVSDAAFRSRLVDFGLSLVGSIPKTKVMSDLDTVKRIMRVKERGGVVGIFPEGQQTWDGKTLPLYYSTAKLLKVLRVPVVTARLSGAFLSKSRWARERRRGKIFVHFELAFRGPELKSASPDDIHNRLTSLLDHDEFEWNRTARIPFDGRRRAEWLERSLFVCPSCVQIGTLRSAGTRFSCEQCGYTVSYNRYGLFVPQRGSLIFETMTEWNEWQIEQLRRTILERHASGNNALLFGEPEVTVETGYKEEPLSKFANGRLEMFSDRIVLTPANGAAVGFYLEDLDGANIQNGERLEFYIGDTLYRVTPAEKRACTYKWALAIGELKQLAHESVAVAE